MSCIRPPAAVTHLSRLDRRALLGDLVRDEGHVAPLLVQDHGELPVQLLDLQVDLGLAFKHLTDLPVVHALKQVLDWEREEEGSSAKSTKPSILKCVGA